MPLPLQRTAGWRAVSALFGKKIFIPAQRRSGNYIAEKDWGMKIGSDVVKRLCRYLFQNTDLLRIFAEPFAYNQASCRILEKAGFALEGVLRKNAVKNGKILDMKMYSIVRE